MINLFIQKWILYPTMVFLKVWYSKTPILTYQQTYSKIGVIYEVFKNFGLQQKIYL